MRRRLTYGLLLILVAAPPLLAGKGDATAGKTVYRKRCSGCHGQTGEPKKAMAKMLKLQLRALGSKEVQAKSDAQLRKDIVEGTGKMKPVKKLSATDVDNVIAYVRTLAKK